MRLPLGTFEESILSFEQDEDEEEEEEVELQTEFRPAEFLKDQCFVAYSAELRELAKMKPPSRCNVCESAVVLEAHSRGTALSLNWVSVWYRSLKTLVVNRSNYVHRLLIMPVY